jgi:ariadne-1
MSFEDDFFADSGDDLDEFGTFDDEDEEGNNLFDDDSGIFGNSDDDELNVKDHRGQSTMLDDDESRNATSKCAASSSSSSSSSSLSLLRSHSFEVLEEEAVRAVAEKSIQKVVDFCNVGRVEAAALLRHCRWDGERVIGIMVDGGRVRDKLLEETGVKTLSEMDNHDVCRDDNDSDNENDDNDDDEVECLICYDSVGARKRWGIGCGHSYCRSCWREYLELKIRDGIDCVFARCMHPKCKELVHESAVRALVSANAFERYNYFVYRQYVEDNPRVKWCPAPGCSYAIECERASRTDAVRCDCGFRWCFLCADHERGDHKPATCEQVDQWLAKASDESENVNWLMANTKRCPQCRAPIEKNGGMLVDERTAFFDPALTKMSRMYAYELFKRSWWLWSRMVRMFLLFFDCSILGNILMS